VVWNPINTDATNTSRVHRDDMNRMNRMLKVSPAR
jgi:hypothetical protein